jgi:hypothetical protein
MADKSPFYIVGEFISPLLCESIIDAVNFTVPDKDREGHYIKTSKTSDSAEEVLYERLQLVVPELMAHYSQIYKGTERMQFEWFPEGSEGTFVCENSEFLRQKWLRVRPRDFTGILFLSDYQDNPPFDNDYEVYGGKLEFAQHSFGFNPTRGTLVVFPSDPHFINITSPVQVGDLYQVRIQLATNQPYLYNPRDFPGNYTTWFKTLL